MFSVILAVDSKGGIGKNGLIPWFNREDLKWFKKKTLHHVVIMGRRTWESLPVHPLPDRINIVLSRTMTEAPGAFVFICMNACMNFLKENHDQRTWFIIGGSHLYNQVITMNQLVDTFYVSKVHHDFECDIKVNLHHIERTWSLVENDTVEDKLNKGSEYRWTYRQYNNPSKKIYN